MGTSSSIGRGIRDRISRVVRDTVLLAVERLRDATPVDTGHAMSNWVPSVGAPFTGIDGSRENVSFAAQQAGIRQVQRYDVGRDGQVFIRNNVPYLKYLDAGSSQQAPPNFVALALLSGSSLAPRGAKGRVTALLKRLARSAYNRGGRP